MVSARLEPGELDRRLGAAVLDVVVLFAALRLEEHEHAADVAAGRIHGHEERGALLGAEVDLLRRLALVDHDALAGLRSDPGAANRNLVLAGLDVAEPVSAVGIGLHRLRGCSEREGLDVAGAVRVGDRGHHDRAAALRAARLLLLRGRGDRDVRNRLARREIDHPSLDRARREVHDEPRFGARRERDGSSDGFRRARRVEERAVFAWREVVDDERALLVGLRRRHPEDHGNALDRQ